MKELRIPFSSAVADALTTAVRAGAGGLALTYKPDELYRVPTDDGSSIAMARYQPRERRRYVEPVVLCHGLGANRFNLDFDEDYSLARYLAKRGFETWVVELRGRGLAGPPADATFDDQARFDVLAAIRTVRGAGHRKMTWIGHSKGGLLAYAHLGHSPEAPVSALVTMGSPVTFGMQPGLKKFVRAIGPLLKLASIPASRLAALAIFGAPPGPITRYLTRLDNVDPRVVKQALANIPSNIPGGVARQFTRWVNQNSFDSMDGGVDYRRGMRAIRIPTLLIAGSRDLMAPPLSVSRAKDYLGGPATLVIAGRSQGFREDYGHSDLAVGRRAPDEVFPVVHSFLAQNSTAVGEEPARAAG